MVAVIPILLAVATSVYASLLLKGPLPHPAFRPAVAIDPAYHPAPKKYKGSLASNERLHKAITFFHGDVNGSESVAIAEDGTLFLPDKYGTIHRATPTAASATPILDRAPWAFLGGGRPLGAEFDKHGNLIVCLPPVGLVMVEAESRKVVVLTSKVDGEEPNRDRSARISYANDLAIDEESGDIYFSDASEIPPAPGPDGSFDTMAAYMLTELQGTPSGRILKYSPSLGTTTVVANGLWFPNGVALSRDRSFLAVAETCSQRLRRVALTGSQAGTVETLLDGLPGFPDGIGSAAGGGFWVPLVMPSIDTMKYLLRPKTVRALVARIWMAMRPTPAGSGQVLRVSEAGEATAYLKDSKGTVISGISSVTQRGNRLYFGHLSRDYVSYLDLTDDLIH